jgi:hypothetical protein
MTRLVGLVNAGSLVGLVVLYLVVPEPPNRTSAVAALTQPRKPKQASQPDFEQWERQLAPESADIAAAWLEAGYKFCDSCGRMVADRRVKQSCEGCG